MRNASTVQMSVLSSSTLQLPVDDLASLGIIVGQRLICDGDEYALLPEEADIFAGSVIERRRASGAARILALELLAQLGYSRATALPKSASGAPIWPTGIIGSLAHDSRFAIAAVGKRDDVDTSECQTLEEAGGVFLITAEPVE